MNTDDYPGRDRALLVRERVLGRMRNDRRAIRRRRTVVAVTGALAGGVLLAAGAAVLTPPALTQIGARCYPTASLEAGARGAGGPVDTGLVGEVSESLLDQDGQPLEEGAPLSAETAVGLCAGVWEDGGFELDRAAANAAAERGVRRPVPPLVACRQGDGLAVVLPGEASDADALCDSVGLAAAE
ncbi:hypothetical protein C5C24_05855 [Rathayibacter sp. AY2B3]|nr:hypothetical protein C5C24_05855 [Rathayibacter sp. AY2B3]PPI20745.1 hypothetical protein C5D44_16200 [Rathayibacter sp. AY1B5]PPI24254.1 hypothetical protein C5D08_03395 [Rathayibacter sp. AY1B6]PPI36720.1 hypothetical protein C5D34_05640 [Rathayibacter sp. AY1B1]